jgi:hypothetical protein
MRILARVTLVLLALIAVLVAVIALQPAEFAIERDVVVAAPPAVIQPNLENLHAFNEWQPFARMDPQMTLSYDGPESGVGASSSWTAPQMGKGRMTVTRVEQGREVEMKLEFFEPMAGVNRVVFGMAPQGDRDTRVSWRMEGKNNFAGKAMTLFAGMEKMMGDTFEQGLATLKQTAEEQARQLALLEAQTEAARRAAAAAAAEGAPLEGDQVPVEE